MNPTEPPLLEAGDELNGSPEGYSAPASKFLVRKLLVALRKYWWVPILTLVLSLSAAAAFVLRMQPTFYSQASIWEAVKMRLPGSEMFSEEQQADVGTQTQVIRSDRIKALAMARLNTLVTNGIPRDLDGKPLEVALTVSQVPRSSVILIGASGSNPAWIQIYLDSIVNVYLEFRKNMRKVVSGDTLASISEEVVRLERKLQDDQNTLLAFEQTNNLAIVQEEAATAGSYLLKLQTQLSDYKLEAQLSEATAFEPDPNGAGNTNASGAQVEAPNGPGSAATAVKIGDGPAVHQLEQWRLEREKLSKYLRPSHPKIVRLDAEIEQAQKLAEFYRVQNRTQTQAQIAATRQILKMKADSVKDSIKQWEATVVDANARVAAADRLKMNLARSQSLYDRFVDLLQSVDVSRNIDQATLAPLEPASLAKRSYSREISVLGISLLAGLAAGLGIVFLIGFRDDRFTSVVEVDASLGNAVVGLLPEIAQTDEAALPLLKLNDPRFMYAESYRSLRSALLFLPMEGERPKVLLITSAIPNEGKSTVAVNLARTLALGGSRVLLVDADLRKGRLHKMLGLPCGPGLVEWLHHTDQLDGFIQSDSLPNLAFLSRGNASGHTSDLFLSPTFDQFLARMRLQYDYVLVDSSPVFAADDASTLAPKVDGTLFVVRGNFSSARQVREALELLQQRQAKILGVVFNRAEASARSYYYYKYADYHGWDNDEPHNGVPGSVNGQAGKL